MNPFLYEPGTQRTKIRQSIIPRFFPLPFNQQNAITQIHLNQHRNGSSLLELLAGQYSFFLSIFLFLFAKFTFISMICLVDSPLQMHFFAAPFFFPLPVSSSIFPEAAKSTKELMAVVFRTSRIGTTHSTRRRRLGSFCCSVFFLHVCCGPFLIRDQEYR